MNLPNRLTMLRIILVPVFVVLFKFDYCYAALIVFVAASLTDMLDGKIARARNLITNFGKLMDPLADKILVMSAMLCFVGIGLAPEWVVIVILAREFLVTSLRLIAAGEGRVIAADMFGKCKTVAQMAWIVCGLLAIATDFIGLFAVLTRVLMWLSAALALLSGANYCIRNRDVFLNDM